MINLILRWLRDNFHWTAATETDDAFDALRDGDRARRNSDEAERAAVRDTIREQRGDTSAFYIPLL